MTQKAKTATAAGTAAVQPEQAAAAAPAPKRKRDRSKRPTVPQASPLEASELCARRVEELVALLRGRAADLLDAQRSKPTRWDYFAALTKLEAQLRELIG